MICSFGLLVLSFVILGVSYGQEYRLEAFYLHQWLATVILMRTESSTLNCDVSRVAILYSALTALLSLNYSQNS